jgi:hypothetical protein
MPKKTARPFRAFYQQTNKGKWEWVLMAQNGHPIAQSWQPVAERWIARRNLLGVLEASKVGIDGIDEESTSEYPINIERD